MKSYSDDIPNTTKEEMERASNAAEEAVRVSKATLASSEDNLELVQNLLKLVRFNIGLSLLNLIGAAGILVLIGRHTLG